MIYDGSDSPLTVRASGESFRKETNGNPFTLHSVSESKRKRSKYAHTHTRGTIMPRLEREARPPTGQIFLIFFPVIGGERGRARTRARPLRLSPVQENLFLVGRSDSVYYLFAATVSSLFSSPSFYSIVLG